MTVTVEVDRGSATSRGWLPDRQWLVRLGRGGRSLVVAAGLHHDRAEHLESGTKRGRREMGSDFMGLSTMASAEVEQLGDLGDGFWPGLDVAHGGAGIAMPGLGP